MRAQSPEPGERFHIPVKASADPGGNSDAVLFSMIPDRLRGDDPAKIQVVSRNRDGLGTLHHDRHRTSAPLRILGA